MRHSNVISIIFLLHCLCTLQSVLGKTDKKVSKEGEPQAFARSGEVTTKSKHVCSWEIVGDATVSLSLRCNDATGSSYNCTYEGEPQKCPLYLKNAKLYWKAILGKCKKMKNACEDNNLKARVCKKSAGEQSQLRKIESYSPAKGRVKLEDLELVPLAKSDNLEANKNAGVEKKSGARKKHVSKLHQNPSAMPPKPDLTTAREVNDDIIEQNENLADAYCAEKWHSLCSLIVNFWNG